MKFQTVDRIEKKEIVRTEEVKVKDVVLTMTPDEYRDLTCLLARCALEAENREPFYFTGGCLKETLEIGRKLYRGVSGEPL